MGSPHGFSPVWVLPLQVSIPKRDGGERKLGIPTITDRIAQTVVKMVLERRWNRSSIPTRMDIVRIDRRSTPSVGRENAVGVTTRFLISTSAPSSIRSIMIW